MLKNSKNVLFIGLGSIGQRHYRNYKNLVKNYNFFAIRKIKKSPELNKKNVVTNLNFDLKKKNIKEISEAAASKKKFDIVFICNPSSLHLQYALKFAKKKVALFIEKPLSHNLQGIKKLEKKIRENKVICAVGYQLRYHKFLYKIKKIIDKKTLGKIKKVKICNQHYLPNHHMYEDYRKGYAAKKKLGGGVLLCFIHEIDYANFLFNIPKSIECISGKKSNLEIDVEDYAKIKCNHHLDNHNFNVEINLDFIKKIEKRKCNIVFQNGQVNWDLKKDELIIYKKSKIIKKYQSKISRNSLFKKQLQFFNKSIELKSNPISNLDNGISSLKVVMMAKKSSKINKKIIIN
ncbi:Gfo/Idh/MocA family protein [Candidatus Pelagibacter sp. HIMB1587]|uniref:Gfo/Idh/MocA family protein n=1 Tax=Candidatus Pelagibacter sp. HIMB1587 TaxID=3413354 RepID=UPI003F8744E5